jgi:hypothetical protein
MLPIPLRKKSWFIIDVGTMARQRRSGFIALLTAYLLLLINWSQLKRPDDH